MARNAAQTLSPVMVATVSANRAILSARKGETVTVDFETRKGEPRTYRAEIVALVGTRKGNDSTEAVVLDIGNGIQKSANLWLIKAIY